MSPALPISRRWLMDGFCWYARRMIRKSFDIFAVDVSTFDYESIDQDVPLVVYSNHPSWWDPIAGMLICREYFKDRIYYAPIDADALKKYRVFSHLGYFGVEAKTRRGASYFLEQATRILHSEKGSLWITPEGRFTDSRDHDQPLMPGIAHLAAKVPNIHCIPLAIECVFGEVKRPRLFCKIGNALTDGSASRLSKAQWQVQLTEQLRATQRRLSESVMAGRWESFDVVVGPELKHR